MGVFLDIFIALLSLKSSQHRQDSLLETQSAYWELKLWVLLEIILFSAIAYFKYYRVFKEQL